MEIELLRLLHMFKNLKFYLILFAVACVFGFTEISDVLSSNYMTWFNVVLLGVVFVIAYFKIGSPMTVFDKKHKEQGRSVTNDKR